MRPRRARHKVSVVGCDVDRMAAASTGQRPIPRSIAQVRHRPKRLPATYMNRYPGTSSRAPSPCR
eukprot:6577520-Prymnesium_polylepis.1